MTNSFNKKIVEELPENHLKESHLSNQFINDWAETTKELIDTLPRPWTRGLLYFLVIFVLIILPWAMLSKVDETGTAKGKLEPQGETVKLDSAVSGTVEEIHVKEGDFVKAGQPLLRVESKLVQAELQQTEEKLAGQENRLSQLNLLRGQLILALSTQQQQNKSQELEKQSQINQPKENLETLKSNYNLQKAEKLAQVNQAKAELEKSKTDNQILKIRWDNALRETERYRKTSQEGVISETQVVDKEDSAKEIERLYAQTKADIKQNEQRLAELESIYLQAIENSEGEIKQVKLRLQEQQRSYQSLKHSNILALLKIEEQFKNLETDVTALKAEIAQTKSQIKAAQIQLTQRILKATVSGTIFQLPIKKAGAVVQNGTRIAEIAPQGSHLILRAQIATNESGFLQKELPVKLKFDAYPFQDYGVVEGKLINISPTTIEVDSSNGKVPTYQLEVELNRTCIVIANKCIPLHPGDTATADVIIRQRRVIDFILDPFNQLQKGGLKL